MEERKKKERKEGKMNEKKRKERKAKGRNGREEEKDDGKYIKKCLNCSKIINCTNNGCRQK